MHWLWLSTYCSPYDASGDRVAPEPSQGDLYDADAYSIGVKLAIIFTWLTQYLQLAANYYNAEQDSDYAADTSTKKYPLGSVPAQAIKGLKLKDQNKNENQIYNLTYINKDLLEIKLMHNFTIETSLLASHHLMRVVMQIVENK